jgi:hypothetical protein
MKRLSLTRLLSSWTRRSPRHASAGTPTWPEIPGRRSMSRPGVGRARLTADELDCLFEFIATELGDGRPAHSPRRDGDPASSDGRKERFLHTVDRAIAEIAGPRGRRRRARR